MLEGGGGVGFSAAVEKIGVDIEIYRARTDPVMDNGHRSLHQGSGLVESASWFKGIVLIVFLVVGGVEVKPGPPAEQDTTDKILKQIIGIGRAECLRNYLKRIIDRLVT